jgi:hypothetical protein
MSTAPLAPPNTNTDASASPATITPNNIR